MRRLRWVSCVVLFACLWVLYSSTLAFAGTDDEIPGAHTTVGTTVNGLVSTDADVNDVWSVDLTFGQEVVIDVSTMKDFALRQFRVQMLSPDSESIDGGDGAYAVIASGAGDDLDPTPVHIRYVPPVSGRYYLWVSASSGEVPYKLSVTRTSRPAILTGDWNDIYGTAITSGTIPGVCDAAVDPEDMYAVRLTAGQEVTVTVSSDSGEDTLRAFYAILLAPGATSIESGEATAVALGIGDYYWRAPAVVRYVPKTSGIYYLWIHSVDGNLPYTMKVEGAAPKPPTMSRVAGPDRYATAIAVSRRSFPHGARGVVLATGANFPDALCAAPLAKAMGGPVLLVPRKGADRALMAELERLKPEEVVIVGSSASVPSSVESALKGLAGPAAVKRLAGDSRYGTSALVAGELTMRTGGASTVVVATGRKFPDALAVAPLAAAKGWPILLTEPQSLPLPVERFLLTSGAMSSLVCGDTSAVSEGVAASLPSPQRLGGGDRYETGVLVDEFAVSQGMSVSYCALVTGENFPDALAAGPMLAARNGLLLPAPGSGLTPRMTAFVEARKSGFSQVDIVGSPASVTQRDVASLGSSL